MIGVDDEMTVGESLFQTMQRTLRDAEKRLTVVDRNLEQVAPMSFAGMPIRKSKLFPFTDQCKKCDGSGSGGEESTYCQSCKGGGAIEIVGVITPELRVMVKYLPKLFEPSFPFPLPVQPWKGFR